MAVPSPAPWTAEFSATGSGKIIGVTDANGKDVYTSCIGQTTAAQGNFNTEVIVRAVNAHDDMLAELREILEFALVERSPLREPEIASIRAVIAKAEGRS